MLLVFVTLCAIPLAWFGWKLQQARQQDQAVAWIKRLGGTVRYHYQFDENGSPKPDAPPPGPVWLREVLPESFFASAREVYCLDLGDVPEDDAWIRRLACLTELKEVALNTSQVTDAEVEKLQKALPNCRITRGVFVRIPNLGSGNADYAGRWEPQKQSTDQSRCEGSKPVDEK